MSQRSFTPQTPALRALHALALVGFSLLPGCMLEKQDDGDEYREALPMRQAVVVAGPETDDAADTSTASIHSAFKPQGSGTLGRSQYAKWYGFTRAVRAGVNGVTAGVL